MRLVIVGGGGFRTPLVYAALCRPGSGVDEVVLHDVDASRLAVVARVLASVATERTSAPVVRTTTVLDEALAGADFVFSAIRVGGLAGRVQDERVALDLGLLGQETVGPGGIAYGLRTVPVAVRLAERVRVVAPEAWVIDFTNPAGMVTEAMQRVLGPRVVGICDTPITMARRALRLLGVPDEASVGLDYIGLNHLGWLRGLTIEGVDVLPRLLADDALLGATEEGRLFGLDWIRAHGALPNEYLYYYAFTREAVAAIRSEAATRGEFLAAQQDAFYVAAQANPSDAHTLWTDARAEREATYMAAEHAGEPREVEDVGGYEGVALDLMRAIAHDERTTMILDVANGTTIAGLPPDAVVEVPVVVGAEGPSPVDLPPPALDQLGLMAQVKAVDRLTIDAAVDGDPELAWRAFATLPLVDSANVARELLAGYRARIPLVDAVFTR